jgi:hypothetical protein
VKREDLVVQPQNRVPWDCTDIDPEDEQDRMLYRFMQDASQAAGAAYALRLGASPPTRYLIIRRRSKSNASAAKERRKKAENYQTCFWHGHECTQRSNTTSFQLKEPVVDFFNLKGHRL